MLEASLPDLSNLTEKLLSLDFFPTQMGPPAQAYGAKKILLLVILILLFGCSSPEIEPSRTIVVVNAEPGETLPFRISSPCGGIVMTEPLANVTGQFSVPVKKGSPVYLYTAPQVSYTAILESIRKCPPIDKVAVGKDGRFTFPYYPVSRYALFAWNQIFKHEVKAPSVILEKDSPLDVRVLSQIIELEYTLTVFSIEPEGNELG